jgi:hypothetical protein
MLKADLHVHSDHSDGIDGVRKLLKAAIERKLDAISITDHDTVNGSLEAIEIAEDEKLPILVIPGIEVSTRDGHLLVYGVPRSIEPGRSMRETAFEVLEGVTAIAHPFQFHRGGIVRIKKAIDAVDAIEVFNAKFYTGLYNLLSARISRKYGKSVIAGSDAHCSKAVGCGITLLDSSKDVHSVIQSIKHGKTRVEGERMPICFQLKTSATKALRLVGWK